MDKPAELAQPPGGQASTSDFIAEHFRPLDSHFIGQPFVSLEVLRREAPVFWYDPMESWVATRYEDCRRILADWSVFASDFRRAGLEEPSSRVSIQTVDLDEHEALHRVLADAMKAWKASDVASYAEDRAAAVLSDIAASSSIDLVTDFQIPIAFSVIARFIGVNALATEGLMSRSADVVRSMIAGLRPENEQPGIDARARLTEAIRTWMTSAPRDSVLGYLRVDAGVQDPSEVLLNSVRVILLAGINTMQRFLGNTILALIRHSDARAAILELPNPGRAMTIALNELVRLESPFFAQQKVCLRDVELGPQRLQRGQMIVALVGSANRDPDRFDNAERIVIDRNPNPHLGFGDGPHSCIGAGLSLIEARVALPALFRRFPHVAVAGEPTYDTNLALPGVSARHDPADLKGGSVATSAAAGGGYP